MDFKYISYILSGLLSWFTALSRIQVNNVTNGSRDLKKHIYSMNIMSWCFNINTTPQKLDGICKSMCLKKYIAPEFP